MINAITHEEFNSNTRARPNINWTRMAMRREGLILKVVVTRVSSPAVKNIHTTVVMFFFYLGTCSTIAAIASTSWVHPGWDGNNPHLGPHRQHGRGQPRSSQNRRVRSNGSNASFGSIKTIMRTSDLHSFASIKSTSNNDVPNIFSFKTEVPNLHPPSITNLFWAKKKTTTGWAGQVVATMLQLWAGLTWCPKKL